MSHREEVQNKKKTFNQDIYFFERRNKIPQTQQLFEIFLLMNLSNDLKEISNKFKFPIKSIENNICKINKKISLINTNIDEMKNN